ncbi:hypothetical protein SUGI_0283090 [Cryptomeria japonica]|nr:hypothetical protein SUGI_0283090 [Cryptomeria japonica]
MKRFFQVVEKDTSSKRVKSNGEKEANVGSGKEPLVFMSWNANSLLLRLKKNRTELADFIQQLDPDVIAIQVGFLFDCLLICLEQACTTSAA